MALSKEEYEAHLGRVFDCIYTVRICGVTRKPKTDAAPTYEQVQTLLDSLQCEECIARRRRYQRTFYLEQLPNGPCGCVTFVPTRV